MTLLWIAAFLWTLAFELPIYVLVLRRHARRWWTPAVLALVVNAATHPAFWFVFPQWEPYWQFVVAGELCVVAVEAAIVAIAMRRLGLGIAASLAANTVSTLLGFVLMPLLVG